MDDELRVTCGGLFALENMKMSGVSSAVGAHRRREGCIPRFFLWNALKVVPSYLDFLQRDPNAVEVVFWGNLYLHPPHFTNSSYAPRSAHL